MTYFLCKDKKLIPSKKKYFTFSSQHSEYVYIISFYRILNSLSMGNELDNNERFVVYRYYFAR